MEELRVMTQQKQAEGTPVVYYVSGVENSECVVFIHAAFADHTQFNPQVNAFSDKYKFWTMKMLKKRISPAFPSEQW